MVGEGSASIEILLIEDNPRDVRLTEEALKDSGVAHNLQVNNYLTKPLQAGLLKMVIGTVQNYLRAIAKIQKPPDS